MAKGFKKGAGGANPLNFKVVGSLTEPVNPKENMIWVNTDQKITLWAFAVEEPTNPAEGMVWIKTNDSAGIEIDLLKKNIASIHLVSAKQYISGAWAEKEVKVWQNGAWQTSGLWLFNYDTLGFTWTCVDKELYEDSGTGGIAPTMSTNPDGSLKFYQSSACGIAYITTPFVFKDYKTLEFDGIVSTSNWNGDNGLSVWSEIGKYVNSNRVIAGAGSHDGTRTVDISAMNDSYYVGVAVCSKGAYSTVRRIRLLT